MRPERENEIQRQVIAVVAGIAKMKAEKLKRYADVDYALTKGGSVRMVCDVQVQDKRQPQMAISLEKVRKLRGYAERGLQARIIFATPEGIFAKKIEDGPIDGWIGLSGRYDEEQGSEMAVYFGPLVVSGKVMDEEKNPLQRLCDSDPSWFLEAA